MIYDENYVRNYIEVNLNDGKTLSEIRQELLQMDIPSVILRKALNQAYMDEIRYLQNVQKEKMENRRIDPERVWWIFVLVILAIIAIFVIAVKEYLIG